MLARSDFASTVHLLLGCFSASWDLVWFLTCPQSRRLCFHVLLFVLCMFYCGRFFSVRLHLQFQVSGVCLRASSSAVARAMLTFLARALVTVGFAFWLFTVGLC